MMKLNKANLWRITSLMAFIAVIGSVSVSQPTWLSENAFLKQLMGPDLVSVLVVALTITFASVANIHLSIGRILASARNKAAARASAARVRAEINSNAWTIFWAFLVALFALFLYGATKSPHAQAAAIAICLTVILLNGLVMHDIYRSIFILVASEPQSGTNDNQDYSKDSPPAGGD